MGGISEVMSDEHSDIWKEKLIFTEVSREIIHEYEDGFLDCFSCLLIMKTLAEYGIGMISLKCFNDTIKTLDREKLKNDERNRKN